MPGTLHYDKAAGPPRGLLLRAGPLPAAGIFEHSRRAPADALQPWIQHYWMVSWDLPAGVTHTAETIPHPNIQLAFSSEGALIHGIRPGKFTTVLKGRSCVFGVKFRAGAFRQFLGSPVASLRGRTIPATDVFDRDILALNGGTVAERIDAANAYFTGRGLVPDPQAVQAAGLVDVILSRAELGTVAQLASLSRRNERALQRLFRQHVGVSPKWVIRRYRMHELIERMNGGDSIHWADVAVELGYFDQSHLIRDFRRLTGYTPDDYRRAATAS